MSPLALYLFGAPRLERDGVPLALRYRKNVALIVYLAVSGEPHTREALIALLWPELEPSRARAGLRRNLSVLRKALDGEGLLVDGETVGLDPQADLWLDVDQFRCLLSAWRSHGHPEGEVCPKCLSALEEAVELYRGDFMAGFSLRDSVSFDDWQFFQSEELRRELASALERLVRGHSVQGAYESAIPYARRWVSLDPLHEPAQRELMGLYAQAGQRAAALRQYEECARVLETELGLPPSRATTSLYERIRAHRDDQAKPLSLAPPAPHNLPAQLTPFIGREAELAQIGERLADPACRLLTLVGPGGMGKTRLALEMARQALSRFPAGAWWADLAPVPEDASVPRAVAAVLGVQEQPPRPLPETIATSLQTRELLLVLDNCEHIVEGAASLVSLLLSRCPELTVLATSREPLHVSGEHLYEVPPMGLPEDGDRAENLLTADAMQLFRQRASAVRPRFALDRTNAPLVAEVCRRLDGMPLAIELAAARMRVLSLQAIRQHLDDRFRLLTGGSRTAHPRQRTLRDTIAWSVDLLDDAERTLFARLSAFAGSFDLVSAGEVCGGEGIPAEEVLERLAGLVDKSLVSAVRAEDGTTRYRLLETVRAYARERLAARGEADQIAARHARYYLSLAEGLEPQLWAHEKEMLSAFARLDAEADNLAAAMRWSLSSGEPEIALRIGAALRYWLEMRLLHLHPFAEWLERALAQSGTGDPACRARALGTIWRSAQFQGKRDKQISTAEEELRLARQTGDPKLIGRAAWDLGVMVWRDQPERGRHLFQETLQAGREHGEPVLVCAAWEGLAALERDPSVQYALMEDALAQVPYCLRFFPTRHLGEAACALGDLARAEGWFQRALEHAIELGALHYQAHELYCLGLIARHRGDYDRAMALLERSQAPQRQAGGTYRLCDSLWAMGETSWCRGDLAQASRHLEQSLDLSRQHGYSDQAAMVQCVLALVACEQGDYDRAVALSAAALDDLPAEWDYEQGLAVSALARVALCRGDAPRAIDLYREALGHMGRFGYRPNIVEAVESLSWALAAGGQVGKAAHMLACTARKRDEMGMALHPVDRPYHERAVETVRAALGQGAFAAAWAEGEGLGLDEAAALAASS